MVILVFLSVIYIVYSRQKLARLKDRCTSAASNNSGITYGKFIYCCITYDPYLN